FRAEAGIRDFHVTGVQTCALPISRRGLLQLPPVLHGQAEDSGHRRPGGPVRGPLRQAQEVIWTPRPCKACSTSTPSWNGNSPTPARTPVRGGPANWGGVTPAGPAGAS